MPSTPEQLNDAPDDLPADAPDDVPTDAPDGQQASVEREGPRVTLSVTVPAEVVSRELDAAAGAVQQRAKLPGFRRGKAPLSMIRQKYGDDIREHVVEQLVPRAVSQELEERGLEPLGSPTLERVRFQDDGSLAFAVRFDVAPDIELREYENLEVTVEEHELTDELVEQALADLREQAAELVPAGDDAAAAEDEFVSARIALFPRDGKGKKLAEEERQVRLGHERQIPGLNEQLAGLSTGDRREFVTRLGEEFPNDILAGKEVTCRVEVLGVKRLHLPDVDDDLARDFGVDNLQELRERTREDLREHLEETRERELNEKLLAKLVEANPFEVPESLVEERLDDMIRNAARRLARRGVDPSEAMDWDRFRERKRGDAKRSVAADLLLDVIADAESITVEDADVHREIEEHRSGQGGPSATSVAQRMKKDGSYEGLRRMLRRQRALDRLKAHATIQSERSTHGGEVERDG